MSHTMSLVSFDKSLSGINSLEAYLDFVKKIPLLTIDEERRLAEGVYYEQNVQSAKQLVLSNLRFVVYVAQCYKNYGLAMGDLIQEGTVGLVKAVKRFNPELKVRLISFAVHWIKAEIQEFILRNWRIVKMATTKSKRKLFFNLRRMKQRLGWANRAEVNQMAKTLGVKPEELSQMEVHLSAKDMSIDHQEYEGEDSQNRLPAVAFSDARYDPTTLVEEENFSAWSHEALKKALRQLDERSRAIIMARWLNDSKVKLHTLAEYYKISMERVRQIEKNAMKLLKQALENASQAKPYAVAQ